MANAVVMPRQGQSVESCILTAWSKAVGDSVNEGELLFSYETDKATFEENAKHSGVLLARFFEEDDDVPCLATVAVIGALGEDVSQFAAPEVNGSVVGAAPAVAAAPGASTGNAEPENTAMPYDMAARRGAADSAFKAVSPRAKELAKRIGIEAELAAGTGPHGRIIERDIETLAREGVPASDKKPATVITAAPPSLPVSEYEEVKQSGTRKAIAKGMLISLQNSAQLTNHGSFDATELLSLRAKFKSAPESMGLPNITLNDIILYACSRVLKKHPDLNAHFVDGILRRFHNVHLGMAVDTPRGLLVPTIFNADSLSLAEISQKSKELASMAQAGNINPDFLTGATFTISNLGGLSVEQFTPVINPPQTGILGIGCIVERIRTKDGAISAYPAMGLSLTYDHRVVDGAPAARFALDLGTALENIACLLA